MSVSVGQVEGNPKEAVELIAVLEAEIERLRGALEQSRMALDDWLNTYAPDMCDEKRVAEAHARIGQYGTLYYIALVQEQNCAALGHQQQVERKSDV